MIRLASGSLTRAELLKDIGIDFIQESVEFDEELIIATSPKNFVFQATLGKYGVNMGKYGIDDYPLLVADTVVTSHSKILRKAKDEKEAKDILLMQSGSVASIITCMIYHSKEKKIVDISTTNYIFNEFDKEDLHRYIKSGMWRGKAGACMVEGFCKKYIAEVQGYESTAMGFNTNILQKLL